MEAVDERHWPVYFAALDRHLAAGGRIVLQAITMRHAHLAVARDRRTWIHKYIFPGGLIPSVRAIDEVCRQHTRLQVRDAGGFGAHYAQTLRLWRERFCEHSAEVAEPRSSPYGRTRPGVDARPRPASLITSQAAPCNAGDRVTRKNYMDDSSRRPSGEQPPRSRWANLDRPVHYVDYGDPGAGPLLVHQHRLAGLDQCRGDSRPGD
jgi:Mycolic acid cyclopropane synthetase